MAQLLHGRATTTARTRQVFQQSAEPAAALARRFGVNPKTVRKWRSRSSVEDLPMGPRHPQSSVLTEVEEAAAVAFRVQTRLSLDDVFVALKPAIPRLTRKYAAPLPSAPRGLAPTAAEATKARAVRCV